MKIVGAIHEQNEDIRLNMTAMIDVVFQLLIFFVMTFKVVTNEGDFSVKMPLASEQPPVENIETVPTVISVKLNAGEGGEIASIEVNDGVRFEDFNSPTMFEDLTAYVESVLAANADPSVDDDAEVEFDIDYSLKYKYSVKAIGAVSGKVTDGVIKTLIENIKFRDNSGL